MTRLPCCIPFCRRTGKVDDDTTEIICGKCWSTTSKRLRKIYFARRRRFFKGDVDQYPKLIRIWAKLKNQAMEGAMF